MRTAIRRVCHIGRATISRRVARHALALFLAASCFSHSANADVLDPNAFASLGALTVPSGTITINTETLTISGAVSFSGVVHTQPDAREIAVFDFSSINISSGVTINTIGTRPLALLSRGDAAINSGITAVGGYLGPTLTSTASNLYQTEDGKGPGGGTQSTLMLVGGGAFGGSGGAEVTTQGGRGRTYGDLFDQLQGGSTGGVATGAGSTGFAFGGTPGGAIEIVAVGNLSLASVFADAINSSVSSNGQAAAGGASGGGILLSANSISVTGGLFAEGGAGAIVGSFAPTTTRIAGGGGGGQIAMEGLTSHTLGSNTGFPTLNVHGGNAGLGSTIGIGSGSVYAPAAAGIITVAANTTIVPTGFAVTLDDTPITSIAGSTTQTLATFRSLIKKDLTINSGGSVMLGKDNPLYRTSSGVNVTTLSVDGMFNMNGYDQTLATLTSTSNTGTIAIPIDSTLTLIGTSSSTYNGALTGSGKVVIAPGKTQVFGNSLSGFTGSVEVNSGAVNGVATFNTTTFGTALYKLLGNGIAQFNGTGSIQLRDAIEFNGQIVVGTGSQLQLDSSTAGNVEVNGTLSLSNNVSIPSLSTSAAGTVALSANTLTVGSGNFVGIISGIGGSLVKNSGSTLTLGGNLSNTGATQINGGTLVLFSAVSSGGPVTIAGGATLEANSSIPRAISLNSSTSTLNVGFTGLTLGDAASFTGFQSAGTLTVGANTVTLASKGFSNLGVLTSLAGGTINAANGVSLGIGSNLSGNGTVSGKVAAGFGSTIEASGGNLALGNSSSLVGFASDGEIYTGTNTLTLNDSNQAVLGSYTQVGSGGTSGTLAATNGLIIDIGHNLEGQGLISSTNTLAKAVIMNGYTKGTGTGLNFNGYVKGIGIFDGTVMFSGTIAPGLSPASTTFNNIALGDTGTLEMELGGRQLGGQYDHLNILGTGTLDGTLSVLLIDGFQPALGDTFNLLDGNTTGSFDTLSLPTLGSGLAWNTSQLYSTGSLSVTAIPEPGMLALVGCGLMGVTLLRRKRRATQT